MELHPSIQSKKTRHIAMIAITISVLFACGMGQMGGAPAPELHVDALLTGTQGIDSRPEPSAEWITSQEKLEQLIATRESGQLPTQDRAAALDIDFNSSRIILVRMGQKPTAGYSLKLHHGSCSISKSTAVISLVWSEPDPDMVTAQVITSPFILLKLSKNGYDSVEVVNQHGHIRFDLPVDE